MRIVVCDDEEKYKVQVKNICRQFEGIAKYDVVGCSSGEELLELKFDKIDILILDIEMKGISGIDVKNRLEQKGNIPIVFLTNHVNQIHEAFGKNVFGFLKKPVNSVEFIEIIRRIEDVEMHNTKIKVEACNGQQYAIPTRDILYIEACQHYVKFHVKDDEIFAYRTLNHWQEELNCNIFIRVNRTYLINMYHFNYRNMDLVTKNGLVITVPRRKREDVKQKMIEFMMKYAI